MHHHLTFEEDDDSSIDSSTLHARTEHYSSAKHQMALHLTSAKEEEEEEDEQEHFSTTPLDDDVWMEVPDSERHLCIHEHLQPHDLCPYPCPYSLDQLHLTPEYTPTPQCMDLSDIFNFPDVMTTASNDDIPNLEDVLEL